MRRLTRCSFERVRELEGVYRETLTVCNCFSLYQDFCFGWTVLSLDVSGWFIYVNISLILGRRCSAYPDRELLVVVKTT